MLTQTQGTYPRAIYLELLFLVLFIGNTQLVLNGDPGWHLLLFNADAVLAWFLLFVNITLSIYEHNMSHVRVFNEVARKYAPWREHEETPADRKRARSAALRGIKWDTGGYCG